MKTPLLKVLSFVSFCLLLAACNSANKIGNVLIELPGWSATAQANQVNLSLRYTNENVFAIAIASTDGKLYLNNEYVGSYVNEKPVGIPQLTSLLREGLLTIEKPEVLQRLRASGAATVAYRVESLLRMEVGEDKSRLKSVVSGQLDMKALDAVAK